jgi:hypothetical protein
MAKLHWHRILKDESAAQLLWEELGHDDPNLLENHCSTSSPCGNTPLISFHYDDVQGNPACCGVEILAGKYLFFGEYCADEDDAGPFDTFEEAFACILDKDAIDVEMLSYRVESVLPLDQTLMLCTMHVAEGHTMVINGQNYLLRGGELSPTPNPQAP